MVLSTKIDPACIWGGLVDKCRRLPMTRRNTPLFSTLLSFFFFFPSVILAMQTENMPGTKIQTFKVWQWLFQFNKNSTGFKSSFDGCWRRPWDYGLCRRSYWRPDCYPNWHVSRCSHPGLFLPLKPDCILLNHTLSCRSDRWLELMIHHRTHSRCTEMWLSVGIHWPILRSIHSYQRHKVMRLPFIKQVEGAWLIHGGKEVVYVCARVLIARVCVCVIARVLVCLWSCLCMCVCVCMYVCVCVDLCESLRV